MTARQKLSTAPAKAHEQHHPKKHHLDRCADRIVEDLDRGTDDELLTTHAVADWLAVSVQWLEIGRGKNYGPPFRKLSSRCIRYHRGDVVQWLKSRSYASTAEYASPASAA
jgi:hypothetical protein